MPASGSTTIYRLKITLQDTRPPVWRRLEVPGHVSLATLHGILNEAMGWTDSHLHEFEIGGMAYGEPDPAFDDGRSIEDDRRWRLDEVIREAGMSFRYRYDFGDDWDHRVQVEAIEPASPGASYPRVLRGARACPPEDIGGAWTYQEILAARADPEHDTDDERLDWISDDFDPAAFDRDAVTRRLQERFGDAMAPRVRRRSSPTARASAARQPGRPPLTTTTVSRTGQLRLPKQVLEMLGVEGGGTLIVVALGAGVMLLRDPRRGS